MCHVSYVYFLWWTVYEVGDQISVTLGFHDRIGHAIRVRGRFQRQPRMHDGQGSKSHTGTFVSEPPEINLTFRSRVLFLDWKSAFFLGFQLIIQDCVCYGVIKKVSFLFKFYSNGKCLLHQQQTNLASSFKYLHRLIGVRLEM